MLSIFPGVCRTPIASADQTTKDLPSTPQLGSSWRFADPVADKNCMVSKKTIAIVGAAGIFPDADELEAFWQNIASFLSDGIFMY